MIHQATKINNITELDSAITEVKQRLKGHVYSNNFLFANILGAYAKSGRLSLEEYDDGIVLLYDSEYSYIVYYYISPSRYMHDFQKRDKPVIVEFHEKDGRINKQNDLMISYWESAGFRPYSTVRRMTTEYTEDSVNAILSSHQKEFDICTADERNFPRILSLLYQSFDPIENMFISEKEIFDKVKNGEFICIKDEHDTVLASMHVSHNDGICEMNRVVVDPEHRGKNLSWHLRSFVIQNAFNLGIKKGQSWVVEKNTAGIESAKKIGLMFDGRYTKQYILS